jgi:hypothetical protein
MNRIDTHRTMDPNHYDELLRLSAESPMLNALLHSYNNGTTPLRDWWHRAIVALTKQNISLQKLAVEIAMRSPAPPIKQPPGEFLELPTGYQIDGLDRMDWRKVVVWLTAELRKTHDDDTAVSRERARVLILLAQAIEAGLRPDRSAG